MKKIIITLSLIVGVSISSFAIPILSITRTGKGLFGYRNVTFQQQNWNGTIGWVGLCQNPGLDRCKVTGLMTDPNDQTDAFDLVEYAENKIDIGSFSLSHSILVHVDGESFDRKYTVTWSTDSQGDGTISVDRTDV